MFMSELLDLVLRAHGGPDRWSKCLDKGEPVRHLLDLIAAFLEPNEIPDFGR
jgi:hypothetical protein